MCTQSETLPGTTKSAKRGVSDYWTQLLITWSLQHGVLHIIQ